MGLRATCLRAVALRLALAIMLGLLLVPGYLAAPVLFQHAASQAQAGMLAGELFHIANRGVLLLAVAVAGFWLKQGGQGGWRWGGLVLLVILVAANEFALTPIMAEIKQAMGPIDAVPKDDPERLRFGMWHGISALIHLMATLAAMLLVALNSRGSGDACKP